MKRNSWFYKGQFWDQVTFKNIDRILCDYERQYKSISNSESNYFFKFGLLFLVGNFSNLFLNFEWDFVVCMIKKRRIFVKK